MTLSKLTELSKGKREYLQAAWPANPQLGRPDPIPMKLQVLTEDEVQTAVIDGKAHLTKRGLNVESQFSQDEVENEISVRVMALACRDNDQPATVSFAQDADDLRRNTTPWERDEVLQAWKVWQERRNPLRGLTAEERAHLDEAVKKKDAVTLRACDADSLVSYMLSSDSQLLT